MDETEKDQKEEGKNRAIVRVSSEFLERLLFPQDARILAIDINHMSSFGGNELVFVVEHPGLLNVPWNERLPERSPVYVRHYASGDNELDRVEFRDWGEVR